MLLEDATGIDLTSLFNENYVCDPMRCYIFSRLGYADKEDSVPQSQLKLIDHFYSASNVLVSLLHGLL